jgi:hypothetical protein
MFTGATPVYRRLYGALAHHYCSVSPGSRVTTSASGAGSSRTPSRCAIAATRAAAAGFAAALMGPNADAGPSRKIPKKHGGSRLQFSE